MRILYRGNHMPGHPAPYSTEAHIAFSLEALGHEVVRIQENEHSWLYTVTHSQDCDLFLWTQTKSYADMWPKQDALMALELLGERMPTVGLHLDLFWGLQREHLIHSEAWFRNQYLFTADGDHDADWLKAGVNHFWSPPGVYHAECEPGTMRQEYRGDVAFVGAHRGPYHSEHWNKRKEMLNYLVRSYRSRFRLYPQREAIRGQDLNDLYASVKVIVGDSCLAESSHKYWSDRATETIGRGGFLIMPWISGLAEMLKDQEHIVYFPPGDFTELRRLIDYYLDHEGERERIRAAGQAHVRANHSYLVRLLAMFKTLQREGAFTERVAV